MQNKAIIPALEVSGNLCLDDFFRIWMKEKKVSVRQSTLYRNNSLYRNHISPYMGKMNLSDISRQQIIELQTKLYPNLRSTTTNMIISELFSIFKTAHENDIIDRNPCYGITRVRSKEGEKMARDTIHRALTIEETEIFLEYAKPYWYYELFLFLFNTGCRCGEASALYWSDVEFDKNLIHIRRTVTRGKDGIIEGFPKTKKSVRDIPMNKVVREILISLKCRQSVNHEKHVFSSMRGKRFTANLINSDIKNLLDGMERRNGIHIDRFSVHATRDTFATRALEAGMKPNTLKEVLGHSSLAMTMDLYAHVMPNTKQQEMDKVSIG